MKLWALPILSTLLMGWVSLFYPHGRDQGSYAYAGWRLLHGELPYRDVYVFKPPMSVLTHSISQGVFGMDAVSIRIFDLGWTMATGLVIARLSQQLGSSFRAGIWAGCMVPVLYYAIDYWNIAQTDGWLVLPSAASLLLLTMSKRWHWGLAGSCAAVAILFKYTAGAWLLPAVVLLWGRTEPAKRFGFFVLGVLGTLALCALVSLPFLSAFYESQLGLIPGYVARRQRWTTLFELPSHKADVYPVLIAAWGGVPLALLVSRSKLVLIATLVSATVMVTVQGKFFDYHYLPLLLPASLALGLILDTLVTQLSRWIPHLIVVGGVWASILIGSSQTSWGSYAKEAISVLDGSRSRLKLWASIGRYRYRDYKVADIEKASAWIAEHTDPDDPIFAWTYEPEVLRRAERRQISRFLYNYPLRVAWESGLYDAELAAALDETPPKLVVFGDGDGLRTVIGNRRTSWDTAQENPVMKHYVQTWCMEAKVARYRMYRPCKPGQEPKPPKPKGRRSRRK